MSKLKKALEKAKDARTSGAVALVDQTGKIDPVVNSNNNKVNESHFNGSVVNVTYTKTQVHKPDPKTLKEKKAFAFFSKHEMMDYSNLLRTQILNKLDEIGGNSLLITSAHPGEGKTFTSINLSISVAQELNRTVLLVDADLRRPAKSHFDFAMDHFGVNTDRGLADYLLGQAELQDLLINPGINKLTILPSGKILPNSAEVIGSARMKQLIAEIKSRYQDRVVIIDGPSALMCPDPVVLSRLVDGVLLVVETERTSPKDIKRLMELIGNRPILGTVLNKDRSKRA
jgi:non-specific protein-tyrosine kinase